MKNARLFLFLFLIVFAVLCFSACTFDFSTLVPPVTTTPQGPGVTTVPPVTTTGPVTTTAPVTTPSPITTTAPQVSINPIKSASLSSDGEKLLLKYDNDISQSLVIDVAIREGFGSALLTDFDFDTETRIVSLTYQATAALNRAELILGNEGEGPITLYLREMGGKLEFCKDPTDGEWTAFAPAGRSPSVNGVPILTELLNQAEYGKQESTSMGNGVIFTVKQETDSTKTTNSQHPHTTNGAYLRFRATEWGHEGYHFVTDARLHGSTNMNFNITTDYEVPENTPTDTVQGGTLFKGSSDDITPLHFNGTYIGANHGYFVIAKIPNTTGLTEEDIGSVWAMGTKKFVLVKILSGKAWFCPFDDSMMESGFFKYVSIPSGATLTHVSGAMNTSAIIVSENSAQEQFYGSTNHVTQHAYLNGTKEIDLSVDGAYDCEFVDFHETYDIIYLPAVLQYLMENVGSNDNYSHYDNEIEKAYVTVDITYRFHKNGAMVVYNDYSFKTAVSATFMSGVQSCAMPTATQYVYLPGTNIASSPVAQTSGQRVEWTLSNLLYSTQPTSTYFQMTSADGATAMNTGYYPLYGDAAPEKRLAYPNVGGAFGWCHTSKKMYPHLFRNNSGIPFEEGKNLSFIAYRIPSVKTDEDFIAKNHYWVGDEIVLSLHAQKTLDGKEVTLPDYMNGMELSIVETSDSFTVNSQKVTNGKISVSCEDMGYVIVKLSPAQ